MRAILTRRSFLRSGAAAASTLATAGWLQKLASAAELSADQIGTNLPFLGVDLFQALDWVYDLGFRTVEPMGAGDIRPRERAAPGVVVQKLGAEDREKVRKSIRRFRHRSIHLPFGGMVVVGDDEALVSRSRRTMEEAFETAAFLEVETAVIHCIPPRTKGDAWKELVELYHGWAEKTKPLGFRLALETGYPRSVRDFVRFIRDVDHPNLGATIDVGHQIGYPEFRKRFGKKIPNSPEAYRAYNDVLHELIDRLGAKLWHFHIHDIDPTIWKEHKPVVHGVIDYPRLFAKLKQTGFGGLMIFEIAPVPGADMREVLAESRTKVVGYLRAASSA